MAHTVKVIAVGFTLLVLCLVAGAGYSVKEEIPYFVVVFLIPSAVALLVWWRYSRA